MTAQEYIKTISELREWLINYDALLADDYHLPGDPPEMTATMLIDKTKNGWSVYYRDLYYMGTHSYYEGNNEAEACQLFLSEIINDEHRILDHIKLQKNLLRSDYPSESCSFDGTHKPNSFILKKIDPHNWLVYFWDGSRAHNIRRFKGERAACYCLVRNFATQYDPAASREFPSPHKRYI